MVDKKQEQKYIRAVSKCLKCSKKDKTECMESFTHSVEDIINQEEDITIEKLEGILGKPQEVAKELGNAIGSVAMKKYARKVARMLLWFLPGSAGHGRFESGHLHTNRKQGISNGYSLFLVAVTLLSGLNSGFSRADSKFDSI